MSNKMICPVCGAGRVLAFPDGTFACDSEYCKSYEETDTTAYNLLIQAKQDLEQSEKCCSAWEIQALDYKAEMIALSGKLEIARNVLKEIKMCCADEWIYIAADKAIELLEHKE